MLSAWAKARDQSEANMKSEMTFSFMPIAAYLLTNIHIFQTKIGSRGHFQYVVPFVFD